jgi:diguanylate cyclase (GGDEF)-like protein/PAS domain S-box-containing protein
MLAFEAATAAVVGAAVLFLVQYRRLRAETARVGAEARLERERFHNAFTHAPTGMAVLSPEGRYLQVNDALCRFLGHDADELLQLRFVDVRHPDDREKTTAARDRLLTRGGTHEIVETRFVRPDGAVVWGRTSVSATRNEDRTVAYFITITEDITAAREAEELLQGRRRWFEAIVKHASDVICLLDESGHITWLSPSSVNVLGFPDARAIGMHFRDLIHKDDRERVEQSFERIVTGPEPMEAVEFRIRHKDGSWRHFETLATNLLDDPDVRAVVTNNRDVSERVFATQQVAHRALHDALTGLANRQLLLDRMDQGIGRARRSGMALAALYLDIDDFKLVNDGHGHAAGDRLLVAIAERLRQAMRPGDTVARIGGDEFVIVAEDVADDASAMTLAERVRVAMQEPMLLGPQRPVSVTASIGIALDRGRTTPDLLLHDADAALYRAKALGKDRCELFDASLRAESVRRLGVELMLRQALEQGDLVVHYQPIVDLASGKLHSVEALLRLTRPTGELVQPNEFLAIAEETGLIVTIGAGVLEAACAQLATWRMQFGANGPERVGINLSSRQLSHPSLVSQVGRVLAETGLAPSMLSVEFDELAIRRSPARSRASIEQLRMLGVSVGIDDFGSGASSLTSLRALPLDYVKLDRTLVAELGKTESDRAIARAVIELANTLGLTTIAEGVENEQQRTALRDMGCQLAQGYLFLPPQPAAIVEHTLFTPTTVV